MKSSEDLLGALFVAANAATIWGDKEAVHDGRVVLKVV